MASLNINKKDKHQSNFVNCIIHSTIAGLIVHHQYYTNHCDHCKSTTYFSNSKHKKDEIHDHINEFQKHQWSKHGQIIPTNWIDPFEIYD